MNVSKDGRIVVAADTDGAVRWHRADDGRELLALQVLPNKEGDPAKWDWVLWTPEGFYQATSDAENALKWVVNHGPDEAATTLAPFRKFSAIHTVVLIHPSGRVLIRRVDMPMCLDIGSLLPSTFNYLPMSDAFDLTCQAQFDGLAPKKRGVAWISRPV